MDDILLARVKNCTHGEGVRIMPFANVYDSQLGNGVFIGPFVEVGGAKIGKNTRISSHSYIPPGVTIGNECFVAHGVMFTNDVYSDVPEYQTLEELGKRWTRRQTIVGDRVRIGSGAVILPVVIGDGAIIGAGAVVVHDVPAGATVMGVPAKQNLVSQLRQLGESPKGPQERVTRYANSPDLVEKPNGDFFLGAVKMNREQAHDFIKNCPGFRTEDFFRDVTPNPC